MVKYLDCNEMNGLSTGEGVSLSFLFKLIRKIFAKSLNKVLTDTYAYGII